jgi:hypothetical protein
MTSRARRQWLLTGCLVFVLLVPAALEQIVSRSTIAFTHALEGRSGGAIHPVESLNDRRSFSGRIPADLQRPKLLFQKTVHRFFTREKNDMNLRASPTPSHGHAACHAPPSHPHVWLQGGHDT